jgi:tetratricopeptide (TPR) repeat protein
MIDSELTYQNARQMSLAGDYDGAINLLNLALKITPKEINLIILKGNTLELKVYSDQSDNAQTYLSNANLKEAYICYESVLRQDEKNIRALVDLGNLEIDADNKVAAKRHLIKAQILAKTEISPDGDLIQEIAELLNSCQD